MCERTPIPKLAFESCEMQFRELFTHHVWVFKIPLYAENCPLQISGVSYHSRFMHRLYATQNDSTLFYKSHFPFRSFGVSF